MTARSRARIWIERPGRGNSQSDGTEDRGTGLEGAAFWGGPCWVSLEGLSGPWLTVPDSGSLSTRGHLDPHAGSQSQRLGRLPQYCPENTQSLLLLFLKQESRHVRQTDSKPPQSCQVGKARHFLPRTSPLNPQQDRAGPWGSCQFSDFRKESDQPRLANRLESGLWSGQRSGWGASGTITMSPFCWWWL